MVNNTTSQSPDTKSKSLSEAFVNSFGSYPIGYVVGIVVLPFSMNWLQEDLFLANIFVTLVFATVSFVRVYSLRRVFEKFGYDDNFIRLAIKLYHKLVKLIPQQVSEKRNRSVKSVKGVL
ncbi:MAG: hypothetical protein IS860_00230 [Nitrosopumilus sp.]|nr:hypothetical protein [Nitrosopumilus sp.]